MLIRKSDIANYIAIILLCIQFFSERIPICTVIDQTGLKHIFLILAIFLGFCYDTGGGKIKIKRFSYELERILFTVGMIIFITFIYMAINGFATYWVSQTYFFVVPILFVYVLFKNDCTISRFFKILNLFTFVLTSLYLIFVFQKITSGAAIYFSFVESESPFEMEIAHMFLLLYMFYTYVGNKPRRIITAICCILAWKRMCLIYLVIFTILSIKTPKTKYVSKKYYVITTLVFAAIPMLIQLVLTDEFSNWFYNTFKIDLIDFMQFRFQSITAAFQSNIPSQGLGTYLYVDVPWYGSFVHMNMHNDIVRLYLEVSIIGLLVFLYGFSSIASTVYSFYVMIFMFIELAVSHMLGNGGIPFWVLAYILIFCFNHPDPKIGREYIEENSANEKNRNSHFQ